MSRRTRVLVTVLCAAATAMAAAAPANAKTLDLVILGDSYSSGNGAGSYTDLVCGRSSRVWGQLYAQTLRDRGMTVNVRNNACGGAITVGGVVPDLQSQVGAVTPETDLVALTIGGNDVGFANIVVQCFAAVSSDPTRCRKAVNDGKNGIPRVQAAALKILDQARARLRPGAKIVVLSYPYLSQPSGYILRGLFDSYRSGQGARELGDLGDQAVLNAAASANAKYGAGFVQLVPTKDLFVGHEPNPDPYRENSASWVWEFTGSGVWPLEFYHPKFAGQQAMAAALLRAAGPDGAFGVAQ